MNLPVSVLHIFKPAMPCNVPTNTEQPTQPHRATSCDSHLPGPPRPLRRPNTCRILQRRFQTRCPLFLARMQLQVVNNASPVRSVLVPFVAMPLAPPTEVRAPLRPLGNSPLGRRIFSRKAFLGWGLTPPWRTVTCQK